MRLVGAGWSRALPRTDWGRFKRDTAFDIPLEGVVEQVVRVDGIDKERLTLMYHTDRQ